MPEDKPDETPDATPATPPWGSDEEFNPEKAWTLIQNLRAQKNAKPESTQELEDLRKKVRDHENADLSDLQKLTKERDEAVKAGTTTATELAQLRAAAKHGIALEDIDLLGTGSAEDIEARAERLAARFKGAPKADPIDGKPKENLPRGGGDPETEVAETDPAKLAAAVPRSSW